MSALRRIIVHQFHNTSPNARIRNKWSVADNRWLKEDGGNLAAFLLRLQSEQPAYFQRIENTIRLILPFFASFELYPEFDSVLLRWREIGSDQVFDVSQASDGMLRVLVALVALLEQPELDLPSVLILDEPELGLHPFAIEVLGSLIQSASKHVQVIIATQSVSLIDRFEADDIVVTTRTGRDTTFRRLSGTELKDWLETYTISELWEKNVVGGEAFVLIRLHILAEGQTEESLVKTVLAPALGAYNVFADVHSITTSRRRGQIFRGGLKNYENLARDLIPWMKARPRSGVPGLQLWWTSIAYQILSRVSKQFRLARPRWIE